MSRWWMLLAFAIGAGGLAVRMDWMNRSALWCDEAESSINALSILRTGLPAWTYLGLPVFENTLTEPWPEHPEYEFRDSTYSRRGVVVYHAWLPLYSIAASQWLCGVRPDEPIEPPRARHGPEEIARRTVVPRLPALVFSAGMLAVVWRLGGALGGPVAAFTALFLCAFNAQTVDFGIQARYYSLTLLMNAVAALCLWRAAERGTLGDFLRLGLASAGLFHTHLFSTIIFAVVAGGASPALLRRPGGLWKSAAGGALSAALVVPWVVLTGFLETASSVPKIYQLLDSAQDGLIYLLERPVPLLLLLALAGLVVLAVAGWRMLPTAWAAGFRAHAPVYALLMFWMVAAYVGFHLLMPAASYFLERLSLVLWTPFVLCVSLLVSDILRVLPVRAAVPAALALALLFLLARGRFAPAEDSWISSDRAMIAALLEALGRRNDPPGTRFYATPNEHLTLTYYSGLPIQSVAPVRREFFDTYPGRIVFIEIQLDGMYPREDLLKYIADLNRWPHNPEVFTNLSLPVWEHLVRRELIRRGFAIEAPQPEGIIEPLTRKTLTEFGERRADWIADMRRNPIFRHVPAETVNDLWLGFFYRFVEPEKRIGPNLNILRRLRNASIELVPLGRSVIFTSDSPPGP